MAVQQSKKKTPECVYNGLSVVAFFTACGILGSAALVLPNLDADAAGFDRNLVAFAVGYFVYTLLCIAAAVSALVCGKRFRRRGAFVCSAGMGLAALMNLLAWKLFAVVFLLGIDRISQAQKIIGGSTEDFLQSQYGEWTGMILAYLLVAVVGISSLIKIIIHVREQHGK